MPGAIGIVSAHKTNVWCCDWRQQQQQQRHAAVDKSVSGIRILHFVAREQHETPQLNRIYFTHWEWDENKHEEEKNETTTTSSETASNTNTNLYSRIIPASYHRKRVQWVRKSEREQDAVAQFSRERNKKHRSLRLLCVCVFVCLCLCMRALHRRCDEVRIREMDNGILLWCHICGS